MDEKPDNVEPRRHWYQYSLRTLLIVVTLAGCGFGWLGGKVQQTRQQAAAVEAIQKLGGHVYYDYEADSEGNYISNAAPPGPALLHSLLGNDFFRNVYAVSLWPTPCTDADVERLKQLGELRVLMLSATHVTDAGLRDLSGLTQLKRLSLTRTQVTDAGLEHLKELTHLEYLSLAATQVTDVGLDHLKLNGLTQLSELHLDETGVTDAGLEQLNGLKQLKWLSLNGTQVTDAGLEQLTGLTRLDNLWLWHTRVTKAGISKLQEALPECRMHP